MKNRKYLIILIGAVIILSIWNITKTVDNSYQWWRSEIGCDLEIPSLAEVSRVKAAVIDSGIDDDSKLFMQDTIRRIIVERGCYCSENEDKLHGTQIAGVIAASSETVKGISIGTEIVSIDITKNEHIEVDRLVDGIYHAISENVDIINISAGIACDYPELHKAVIEAARNDIIVIAATGNYDEKCLYPAAYSEVLRVGALDKHGNVMNEVELPAVYLPGEYILTAGLDGNHSTVSGSSISCGIMTGMIARMYQDYGKMKPEEVLSYFYSDSVQANNTNITLPGLIRDWRMMSFGNKEKSNKMCEYNMFSRSHCGNWINRYICD